MSLLDSKLRAHGGHDGLAPYFMYYDTYGSKVPCIRCGRHQLNVIQYKRGKTTGLEAGLAARGITVQGTLLKGTGNVLCLDCWPYFQRQIIHMGGNRK